MLNKDTLEIDILELFKSHQDISAIYEFICETDDLDTEDLANILGGALAFMDARLNRLYRTFDEMESNGQIE